MRALRLGVLLLALLGLPGCSILAGDAAALHDAMVKRVNENHDNRRADRAKCRELLARQVGKLEAEERYGEARALIGAHYEPLLTVQILKQLLEAPEDLGATAWACETGQPDPAPAP